MDGGDVSKNGGDDGQKNEGSPVQTGPACLTPALFLVNLVISSEVSCYRSFTIA